MPLSAIHCRIDRPTNSGPMSAMPGALRLQLPKGGRVLQAPLTNQGGAVAGALKRHRNIGCSGGRPSTVLTWLLLLIGSSAAPRKRYQLATKPVAFTIRAQWAESTFIC